METITQKQSIPILKSVMDVKEEYVLSNDYVLPEYCPDVAAVLKCMIVPYIQNRQCTGDQLLLEGTACIRVLYLDEERQSVREAEFSQPLSCAIKVADATESSLIHIELIPQYSNCRATSPRRLEVRGAFTICAYAETADEIVLFSQNEDKELFTRTMALSSTAPQASAEKILTVNEVLDFDADLPEAELLLGGECSACVTECKLLSGKAIVKGQLTLHQLYTDDSGNGTVHTLDYVVPISQIMDIDGVQEGQQWTADISVLSDTERCALNAAGQKAALEINIKALIQVQTYATVAVPAVYDAFHACYPVSLNKRDVAIVTMNEAQKQTATLQKKLDLPADNLAEILDVWVQTTPLPSECANGKAVISGKMMICMLVRDADGVVAYYERPEEFSLEYPAQGNMLRSHVTVTGVSYSVMGNQFELRITLGISLTAWDKQERCVVENITLNQDAPFEKERAQIKLYYAEQGEMLWDIAERCHVSPTLIQEENDCGEETIGEGTVLMIPIS